MSNEADQQQFQFRELDKFGMYTDAPGVQGRRSRLVWSSYRGNPRITVFTGVPDDTNKGVIQAPMNPETFLILMTLMKRISESPAGTKEQVENWTVIRKEGEQRDRNTPAERTYLSTTWIGKDKDGICWISVKAENRPTIVFKFGISDFHRLKHGNGDPFTEADASVLAVNAWIEGVKSAMLSHMTIERAPREEGQTNGRGGFGNKGNAPKKPSFDDLDDIPL